MLAGPERIARFIETGRDSAIAEAFAADDVTIIENFAPHVFTGPDAVARWRQAMGAHLAETSGLRHGFGPVCDFALGTDEVFFTLPTRWQGLAKGRRFTENGGWAFLLARDKAAWRVKSYAWAVTDLSLTP
jgi:hypothetical protein